MTTPPDTPPPAPRLLTHVAEAAGAVVHHDAGGEVEVSGVTLDSRRVSPGDVYAALPGARVHGADFAASAVVAGAVAVLTDEAGLARTEAAGVAGRVPVLVAADPRAVLGGVASFVYGQPSHGLTTLGVTGTNGKTTITYLLDGALVAMGARTGLVGTVETRVAGRRIPSVRTTPESPDLQRLLGQMVAAGVDVCSMEVSSHALSLHRVDAIRYDVAAFTNLSQDHLDFHGTLEAYFEAKAQLFDASRSRRAVVCIDDEWGLTLARRVASEGAVPVTTLGGHARSGVEGASAHWQVTEPHVRPDGSTSFTLVRSDDASAHHLVSVLPGSFNVTNTALAFLVLTEAGFDAEGAAAGLADLTGVPGRMQRIILDDAELAATRFAPDGNGGGQPLAIVDFAHSPDALTQAIAALRPATPGKLVIVFGAGGDRDPGKRPGMGAAAVAGADVVVVTDDNPRSEDPSAIRDAVMRGARAVIEGHACELLEIPGRGEAVAHAVSLLTGPEDTVLLAGKGHESGQEIAGVIHPFDDALVLHNALRRSTRPTGGA